MKKNQFSLDSFLNLNKKKDDQTKNAQNSEKKVKTETQQSLPKQEKKSQKRENPPEDDLPKSIQKDSKESFKPSQQSINKDHSILFRDIVDVLLKVETCKGENSKDAVKELLSNLFVNIINNYSTDLPKIYYFLSSKVGPEYISPEFGIGVGILEKIVGKVIGISDKQIKEKLIETGDLGLVASEGKKNVKTMDAFSNFIKVGPQKKLTINQIMNVYKNVAIKKGKSSQDEKIIM